MKLSSTTQWFKKVPNHHICWVEMLLCYWTPRLLLYAFHCYKNLMSQTFPKTESTIHLPYRHSLGISKINPYLKHVIKCERDLHLTPFIWFIFLHEKKSLFTVDLSDEQHPQGPTIKSIIQRNQIYQEILIKLVWWKLDYQFCVTF